MPNLDSNTRTSGSWDPDEPIFLMAQKFTACEYPYGGFQKNEGTPRWIVSNGKSICKWMIWGNPYFRNPTYHHISGFWLLLVPVRHVEVSKKMEVPKNHAKLMVINAKTQWFVVPIFLGTPLKWRDPIIRLGEVR
jgi:hypothetical protein